MKASNIRNAKERLMTVPVLKYFDFTQEFIITTDASIIYTIGIMLLHKERQVMINQLLMLAEF